jgi:hypothetical protein
MTMTDLCDALRALPGAERVRWWEKRLPGGKHVHVGLVVQVSLRRPSGALVVIEETLLQYERAMHLSLSDTIGTLFIERFRRQIDEAIREDSQHD